MGHLVGAVSMKSVPTALWLLPLAAGACGGSSRPAKARDAASVDANVNKDAARDNPAGTPDTPAASHDGPWGSDGRPWDVPSSPDAPAAVPDVAGTCHVDITAVMPPTLTDLTAGPTASLRAQGTVAWAEADPFPPAWNWSVTRSDGQVVASKVVAGDPSQIQFPISLAGRYDITVDIGGGCGGAARALVQDARNQSRTYRLRALPPASAVTAVPYEIDLILVAGVTEVSSDIALDTGIPVAIDPTTTLSFGLAVAVPWYIRIQSSASTWAISGRSGKQGPFRTVLDLMLDYEVLVVPDPPADARAALPPYLLNRSTSGDVKVDARYIGAYANPLMLPQGIAISGHLRGPQGPAENATIGLAAYHASTTALFSTVGRADGDGAYSLRVNPAGAFTVVITPPPGSPLPVATIDQPINLTDPSAAVSDLNFEWQALPTADLTIAVTLPDGSLPPDTVAVRAESPFPAGVLTLPSNPNGGGDPRTSQGTVRRDGATDRYGAAAFSALPKGTYDVTLVPSESMSSWGLTKAKVSTENAKDTFRIGLPLAAKVWVMGRLLDARDDVATDSAGATVVASDLGREAMARVVTSVVFSDGTFFLPLDPDRTQSLVAQPLAGRGLPSRVPLSGFSTGRTNMQLEDHRISQGVLVSGRVTHAGAPLAGVVLPAFCVGLAPNCQDRADLAAGDPPAFASASTDGDGSYAFYLPDPATTQ
jgi:hypothetical protein